MSEEKATESAEEVKATQTEATAENEKAETTPEKAETTPEKPTSKRKKPPKSLRKQQIRSSIGMILKPKLLVKAIPIRRSKSWRACTKTHSTP